MKERGVNRPKQNRKQLHFGLWIVVITVIIVIIVFAVATIWIFIHEGIIQESNTLNFISIMVAIVIGLSSIIIGFFQLRNSAISDAPKDVNIPTELLSLSISSTEVAVTESEQPDSSGPLPQIWNVPYQRNPFFTDR